MNTSLLLVAIAYAVASPAYAEPQCTQQTTRGHWMYTCEGELGVPARLLGTCNVSKSGTWDCSGKANVGGTVLDQTLVGQANNLPDCTGTISYTQTLGGGAVPGTLDIYYVISDGGDSINGLPVNSGGVLACTLKRTGMK